MKAHWWDWHPIPHPSHAKRGSAEYRRVAQTNDEIILWMRRATAEIRRLRAQLNIVEEVGTDEIEAAIHLRQKLAQERVENERLREALAEVADELDQYYHSEWVGGHPHSVERLRKALAANPARVALKGECADGGSDG